MKKINKITSILLVVLMLLSTLPVMLAQAAEGEIYNPDYEIEFGNSLTVTAEPEDGVYIKFVPEKSCRYIFRSESESGKVDTAACLFDANGEELGYEYRDDNAEEDYNFELAYEFEAGKVYYLNVFAYSENPETFKIIIECGHIFEDGTCTVCGKVCDHTEMSFLGFCLCKGKFISKDINNGEELEFEFESANEYTWFRFTPETSGTYSFKSVSETCDPDCFLYDSYGTMLHDSYDVNGMDFNLNYYFEAGESYYFYVNNCRDEGTVKVVLTLMVHTANDGSIHNLEFVEGTYSNCTKHGYTDGLYCAICEAYVSGHEELPLDEEYHIDDDNNKICDLCGKENTPVEDDCQHICHSENFFVRIFWKIANFFNRLFGLNPVCECGEAHY